MQVAHLERMATFFNECGVPVSTDMALRQTTAAFVRVYLNLDPSSPFRIGKSDLLGVKEVDAMSSSKLFYMRDPAIPFVVHGPTL